MRNMPAMIFLGSLVIIFLIVFGTLWSNHEEVNQMKVCVSSGNQWVVDSDTGYMECVNAAR